MLTLPVSTKTFTKGFLNGQGSIEITGSGALAAALKPDEPFPAEARDLVFVKVGAATPELTFGTANVPCKATFAAGTELSLTLAQPGDDTPLPPGALRVGADRIGALLTVGAHAEAAAGATATGPAGFTFGLSAKGGGKVEFQRYRVFDRSRAARSILEDILSDVRLPQSRGTLADLPQPGEVVRFAYGGFLELAAALNWGYSLTGSEGFKVRDIEASLDYALRAKAALTLNYRLAGEFAVTVMRGHDDGWARVTVRKDRESRLQVAAGFELDAQAEVKGLPETPDEFLAAFLGTDVKSVLGVFEKAVTLTDLETLEATVGKLLSGAMGDLAGKWLNAALEHTRLEEFLGHLRKAIEAYRSIDDRLVNIVTELYEKTLGPHKDEIVRALTLISRLSSKESLAGLTDQAAWGLIQQIAGGDVFKVAFGESRAGFAELQAVASTALRLIAAPDFEKLRDLIGVVKSRLKLDELFGRLEQVSSPEKLKALTDKTLQGLVERIVGKAFEQIREGDVGKAVKELNNTLKKLDGFKDDFVSKLRESLHQSVSFRLNFLYTRATADQALLDVDIDVRSESGERLFRDAVAGRMRQIFDAARGGGGIIVHDALLTHEVTRASQLQVNVFGWEFKRLVEVVAKTEISLQANAGGLLQVFTTEVALKELMESGRKHKELTQANFLLRMAGETFGSPSAPNAQEYVIRTLERMSVTYDLVRSDDMTDIKELTEYVALGQHLGLVPDGLIQELERQFGKRLGKVKAAYTVRYDHKAVHDAFVGLSGGPLEDLVRQTARSLIKSATVTRAQPHMAVVGLAYADPDTAKRFRAGTLEQGPVPVKLPGWLTGGAGRNTEIKTGDARIAILRTWFLIENSLAQRVVRLDKAIDQARLKQRAVPVEELEEAAKDVVSAGAEMDRFGAPNTFFGVFDALVREGGGGKAHRESALVLEITPPGGATVTKFFIQGPPVERSRQ